MAGGSASWTDETPKVPIILHFGKTDASIPTDKVEEIREAHPEVPIYLYDAGHGFVSDRRRRLRPRQRPARPAAHPGPLLEQRGRRSSA